jgi:hypothetical protein
MGNSTMLKLLNFGTIKLQGGEVSITPKSSLYQNGHCNGCNGIPERERTTFPISSETILHHPPHDPMAILLKKPSYLVRTLDWLNSISKHLTKFYLAMCP